MPDLVPGIHDLFFKDVDGRDTPGHDEDWSQLPAIGAGAARKFFIAYHNRCRLLP